MVNPQTTLPAAPSGPISYTDVSGVKRSFQVRGRCFNCHTIKTPTWRKGHSSSTNGKLLCNKCGLAETTQGRKRACRSRENNNPGCGIQNILGPDTMITGDRLCGPTGRMHPTAMTQTDKLGVDKPHRLGQIKSIQIHHLSISDPTDAQATGRPDLTVHDSPEDKETETPNHAFSDARTVALASAPSQAAFRAFYGHPTPPKQHHCPSEMYVANMYALLDQLGSSVENIQSISNTFIIDTRMVENGSTFFTLLDIVLLTSGQQGICSSEITGLWDDVFRRQGIFTMPGDDPVIRDASYAHSRLIPSSNEGRGSPRILRFADDRTLGFKVLESGNSAFSLPRYQAIEATLDHFHLHNSVSHKMAIDSLTTLISAMEDLCEEWLIGILGVASLVPLPAQKESYIAIHIQYMVNVATIEEKAASQANYQICPLTGMRYQDMTTMAQTAIYNLGKSITSSIGCAEMDNKRIPSPQESELVRFFGRTMAQWQIAFFLLEPEPRKSHQSYMKAVVAPLRNKFFSMSSHFLVPNYPGELRKACSGRRTELARCLLRGVIPPPFSKSTSTRTLSFYISFIQIFNFQRRLG
ncbi:hypothetical protein B0H11DRAFT_2049516 [Mycena galericulata]|nr:hypothetical protein B0H11DRAFT_2049516 [Mycena galericulata]